MGVVSSILDFRERGVMPTLVLVDLHDDCLPGAKLDLDRADMLEALENCRAALFHARQSGFPVAFVRHSAPATSFLAPQAYPSWIRDIRPSRSEMIFERAMPSCYASSEFAHMARASRQLVLAGLFGETSCLSTLVEGYGQNHYFVFLANASVSRERAGLSADEVHRGVAGIASLYSEVLSTDAWIERMSRRVGVTGSTLGSR
jgi:nicotinamidase-related amidase